MLERKGKFCVLRVAVTKPLWDPASSTSDILGKSLLEGSDALWSQEHLPAPGLLQGHLLHHFPCLPKHLT